MCLVYIHNNMHARTKHVRGHALAALTCHPLKCHVQPTDGWQAVIALRPRRLPVAQVEAAIRALEPLIKAVTGFALADFYAMRDLATLF